MKNPYRTEEYKDSFTYDQATELMNNLNSVKTILHITFGSNANVDKAIFMGGLTPSILSSTKHKSLKAGTKEQYEYAAEFDKTSNLLDDQGNYLYNNYDKHYLYFESPVTPIYLAIDHTRKEFMFQYPNGVCIFGDTTGSIYFIKLD